MKLATPPKPARPPAPPPEPAKIVLIAFEKIRQANGDFLLHQIREIRPTDEITVAESARITGKSVRTINWYIEVGHYKTARRSGPSPRSTWVISRAEVLARFDI